MHPWSAKTRYFFAPRNNVKKKQMAKGYHLRVDDTYK